MVEDDAEIGRVLESALRANGHHVRWVRTGGGALAEAQQRDFDLILLDLGLPDRDGVGVCRELRGQQPGCVLVMLTARTEELDIVVGLEAGADDYLTKPFGFTELLARVRAHLRRSATTGPAGPRSYSWGDLQVDVAARRCQLAGADLVLRPKEFDLLTRLLCEAGDAVSRETLMAEVWDENWFGSTKTLDVHVAALRRRLTEAAAAAGQVVCVPTITTLRGYGYRLEAAPGSSR